MGFMEINELRLNEVALSYNLIIDLAKYNGLSEYYNESNKCLEHFRDLKTYIRRTKKAFGSFVPKELFSKNYRE